MQVTERPPRLEAEAGVHSRAFEIRPFRKPRFDFIWHHHPELELTCIVRGHGVRYIGNSILPFYEGDLCLLGAHLPHAYGSHPKSRPGAEWIVVHFLASNWGEKFWQLPENRAIGSLLAASARGIRFTGREAAASQRKLQEMAAHPNRTGVSRFLDVLETLAGSCERRYLNAKLCVPGKTDSLDPRLGKIINWVQSHSGDSISQSEAAALIGMSPAAFSRFFHAKTDRVFNRYVSEVRIARVCARLLATDNSITEIAGESGFENLSNFNRRFREIVKMTPREYRDGFSSGGSI